MRIVFMGTPDFAASALRALVESEHEVVAVVTQPDKPKGRGKHMMISDVKEVALEYNLPVLQPVKIKEAEEVAKLREFDADVFVVAAFGQILTEEILTMPKYGCVNIHASLLPRFRGAAPIQWSIIEGDKETGVTTMMMDKGIDTGDMLEKIIVPIANDETGGSLFDKLADAGASLILSTLEKLEQGTLTRTKQNDAESCYAKMLDKTLGEINWSQQNSQIERLIRGLNPWPSAYTFLDDKSMKVWKASLIEDQAKDDLVKPGTVVEVTKKQIVVKTGDGLLAIDELQLAGKKRMETQAFLLGYKVEVGTILGDKS